jgi:mRNA-degrading endonuclease RelE of RelBE toxin-antitoxin system
MVQIYWTGKAAKDLRKLPARDQEAVRCKVNSLGDFPIIGNLDFKKLTDMKNQFRLRVGNYRVLIELHGGTPVVIEILHVLRRNNSTY